MKKSSLVMILALVGCQSGKQVQLPKNGMTIRGTEPGNPCVLVGNLVKNCDIDGGVVISKFVECDPHNDFGIKCPAGAKIIGNIGTADGGINVGNDPVYSNNPLSHGNEVVILPDKPAPKPKPKKKPVAMTGDGPVECIAGYKLENHACVKIEEPNLATPDKAAPPVALTGDPERDGPQGTLKTLRMPSWAVTFDKATGDIKISDPKHEFTCYYGNIVGLDASSGLTITCIFSVEKAK